MGELIVTHRRTKSTEQGQQSSEVPPIEQWVAEIARRITQMREQLGDLQKQTAADMGVLPTTLNRWEHGTRTPDVLRLAHWCQSVGGSLDFIYLGRLEGITNPELAQRLADLHGGADRSRTIANPPITTRRGRQKRTTP